MAIDKKDIRAMVHYATHCYQHDYDNRIRDALYYVLMAMKHTNDQRQKIKFFNTIILIHKKYDMFDDLIKFLIKYNNIDYKRSKSIINGYISMCDIYNNVYNNVNNILDEKNVEMINKLISKNKTHSTRKN